MNKHTEHIISVEYLYSEPEQPNQKKIGIVTKPLEEFLENDELVDYLFLRYVVFPPEDGEKITLHKLHDHGYRCLYQRVTTAYKAKIGAVIEAIEKRGWYWERFCESVVDPVSRQEVIDFYVTIYSKEFHRPLVRGKFMIRDNEEDRNNFSAINFMKSAIMFAFFARTTNVVHDCRTQGPFTFEKAVKIHEPVFCWIEKNGSVHHYNKISDLSY